MGVCVGGVRAPLTPKILTERTSSLEQKEFQIPLADRADQVLSLVVPFFLLHSEVMIFLNL